MTDRGPVTAEPPVDRRRSTVSALRRRRVAALGRVGASGRRPVVERGSVTAELAVGLPALVLLLLAALTAVSAVTTKLQCVDAAREAVRAAARGESGTAAGKRVAPSGASVSVSTEGGTVRASISTRVRPLGPYLPGIDVNATAVAEREPGADL
jgi:hypothetical protein